MIAALVASALLVSPAGAPAHTSAMTGAGCGSVVSGATKYPVRIVSGDVACSDAIAALGGFLDQGTGPAGWICARGHYGDRHAARCASDPDGVTVVEAVNPPAVDAPRKARQGKRVTAIGSGLEDGRYSLTLVSDEQPVRGARCLARVGGRRVTEGGWVTLSGRIPRKLRCYQGLNSFLGKVPTSRGAYHLVVGVRIAPAGWDGDHTFIRRRLRVR